MKGHRQTTEQLIIGSREEKNVGILLNNKGKRVYNWANLRAADQGAVLYRIRLRIGAEEDEGVKNFKLGSLSARSDLKSTESPANPET